MAGWYAQRMAAYLPSPDLPRGGRVTNRRTVERILRQLQDTWEDEEAERAGAPAGAPLVSAVKRSCESSAWTARTAR